MGFLMFPHITALNRFAFLLYCSDDAQTYRIVVRLDVQGVPEKRNFNGKKIKFLPKKHQKIAFFGVFTHYSTNPLRIFTARL